MAHFPLSPPSGRQHPIAAGGAEAVLVDVGGGVRAFSMHGRPVLAGYAESALTPRAAGTILAPWPNRIAGGRYRHAGTDYQLDLSDATGGNAIHGLARWSRWSAIDEGPASVELAYDLPPVPGYPFPLQLSVRWSVSGEGLRADLRVANLGGTDAPFGLGVHPYLDLGGGSLAATWLCVPAERRYELDEHGIPTGSVPVAGTPLDLRAGATLAGPRDGAHLDAPYGGLTRDADGRAEVRVRTPGGVEVAVWMDSAFDYVQVFGRPAGVVPGYDTDALAVEPMTCPPNAFNSGDGLVVLAPGERWEGSWGVGLA